MLHSLARGLTGGARFRFTSRRLCSTSADESSNHHHAPHSGCAGGVGSHSHHKTPSHPSLILQQPRQARLIQHSSLITGAESRRFFNTTNILSAQEEEDDYEEEDQSEENAEFDEGDFVNRYYDPKDRTRYISPELSIKYMDSVAYRQTYGDEPVWKHYRRNLVGGGNYFTPKTRDMCIRGKQIKTGSPCPICRDMYLVFHYKNLKLLNQFIDPYSGVVYDTTKTNICQEQWKKLLIHIEKAKDYGYLDLDVDQVYYNLDLYKK